MRLRDARRVRRAALLLPVALAVTACTTSPTARYRSSLETWRASGPAPVAGASDAALFPTAVLERAALVRRVLERNPTLSAARHAWRAALARVPQATALDDPMLGAGVAPRSFGSSAVDDAYKLDLSQKLPFPGKLRLRGEAALGEADAAGHDAAALRLELTTLASRLFDDYVLVARSLAINAEHVALLREFQHIATARYESGEASQQDPLQAEVQLAHALHREIVLQTVLGTTAERINALLHRAPDAPLPPPPAEGGAASAAAEPGAGHEAAEALSERALAERPELAAAAAREAAEQARVDLARREYFPDFTLVGSHNELWQERDLQPFVGLQLNVPLQLGRRRAALEEAEARLAGARDQRLALEDEVLRAVRTGAARLAEAHHVARLYRDRLLPASRDQVAAARAGFETGRNSFLALIQAERNRLDVELGHAEVLADLGRRRAELDRAAGRIPGLDW